MIQPCGPTSIPFDTSTYQTSRLCEPSLELFPIHLVVKQDVHVAIYGIRGAKGPQLPSDGLSHPTSKYYLETSGELHADDQQCPTCQTQLGSHVSKTTDNPTVHRSANPPQGSRTPDLLGKKRGAALGFLRGNTAFQWLKYLHVGYHG